MRLNKAIQICGILLLVSCTKVDTHFESVGVEKRLRTLKKYPVWIDKRANKITVEVFGSLHYETYPYKGEPTRVLIHGKVSGYNNIDTIYFRLYGTTDAEFYTIDGQTGDIVVGSNSHSLYIDGEYVFDEYIGKVYQYTLHIDTDKFSNLSTR